ncbi:glycosyltransferase family 4 protein [Pseudanabaena sp. UWO311]|uniref:glycosyltransferase family 4 protein n=1 Tax=Pseudanabaena sp. UWO311 TaxID=2487337 RepID=UPI00115A2C57|nr:glycosyltransferase family 4 protein [Pseudanabaena sp. UWO311]TYQ26951.1 glycosyltransferase family 4 protein [Pseudanabaena sp. UWO311]
MKIAMIHADLPNESNGGVAFQSHYLSNTLVSRGHDVTMFTFSPHYKDCLYSVSQYPPTLRTPKFQPFLLAYHLLRTNFVGFDVIHSHGDNYLMWGKHPQVRTFHGSAKDEASSAVNLKRRVLQSIFFYLEIAGTWVADINVGVSEATRLRIPVISDIIPCGVDIQRFKPAQKSEHPTILFVGSAGGRKRGSLLAQTFCEQVLPQFPNAELWAVSDIPLVGERISNFGRVPLDTLSDLFQKAWIFCLPSTYEGFGVPYIEAMASGAAVVASPNLGAKEVLTEGKYGLIAEDDQLGNSINRLIGNPDLLRHYIEQGLVRSQDFSWDRVAEKYEQVYEKACASKSKKNEAL